jgi:hypothetical protein
VVLPESVPPPIHRTRSNRTKARGVKNWRALPQQLPPLAIPQPFMVIGTLSPSMSIVVEVLEGPSTVGVNVYENSHEALDANSTPAQFWLPPKFVGSVGAPPA